MNKMAYYQGYIDKKAMANMKDIARQIRYLTKVNANNPLKHSLRLDNLKKQMEAFKASPFKFRLNEIGNKIKGALMPT